jgi:cation/acetate symporter
MLLFWKKTTAKGITTSILVGLVSAVGLILLSQETFEKEYHLVNVTAPMQINNPAIFSMPLSFLTLVIVSLLTQKKTVDEQPVEVETAAK